MTLNCPNNCETHEQKRNVVRPDYLALSISGRKLHSQNGTQDYGEDIKINDAYSLHFDVNSNKITIKTKNGETINIDSSYLTDIQNVLNSNMPQEQKEAERTKLDWYLAEKVILSLPQGFIEKPNRQAATEDAKKMGGNVVAQGAKVPWSNETIR